MEKYDQIAFDWVRNHYLNDYGNPFEMTPGQIAIFRAIYEKESPRVQVESYTQYGKSDVVAMAVLSRIASWAEKWPIVGGTTKKAKIIMGYVIKHIFENTYTRSKFQIGKDESLERIKRERSKERITLKVGDTQQGEIFILSAEARRKGEDAGNILIGYGAPNLIEDDSPLTPDNIHGKAMRMLGGHKENFLLKIGNTFNRNHFFKSHNNPKYKKITIDYHQGIEEGRVTPEYIEEMRGELDPILFGILYECKFPEAGMIEEGDWLQLISEVEIEEAQKRKVQSKGYKRLGVDIGEGGAFNAYVIKTDNYAFIKEKNLEPDPVKTGKRIGEVKDEEKILSSNIFVDAIGPGSGTVGKLNEMGIEVNAVKSGEKPSEKTEVEKKLDPIEFLNLRAEISWEAVKWIRQGGALEPSPDWKQLCQLRYKEAGNKTIKIMSKEEMRIRGMMNLGLDVADAFFLNFVKKPKKKKIYHTEATKPLNPYYPELGY